jgi:hypothetical protein
LTKTTAAWVVGTNQGGLDTGSIAAGTWYHVYLIKRPDTGVVDVLFSLSAPTPATLPTNYTLFRRIGSARTNSSAQWTSFTQDGDLFQWMTPVADVSGVTNPGTTAVLRALASVPPNVNVEAIIQPLVGNAGTASVTYGYFSDPALADVGPSANLADTPDIYGGAAGVGIGGSRLRVRTNASQQIRTRLSYSDGSVTLNINTLGWVDRRGRDN